MMLRYASALEEAIKEGNWPLFRSGPLEVPGSYAMLAPWKVAAVAAILVQVSELASEKDDHTVWGMGGPGCLEGAGGEKERPSSVVALRWGASPRAPDEGDVPLWLTLQGTCVGDQTMGWLARDCGQELTMRVLQQTTPPGVSSLLSAVNWDS